MTKFVILFAVISAVAFTDATYYRRSGSSYGGYGGSRSYSYYGGYSGRSGSYYGGNSGGWNGGGGGRSYGVRSGVISNGNGLAIGEATDQNAVRSGAVCGNAGTSERNDAGEDCLCAQREENQQPQSSAQNNLQGEGGADLIWHCNGSDGDNIVRSENGTDAADNGVVAGDRKEGSRK